MSSALIFGVSGQDGAYLAELLLAKGYAVHGATRGDPGALLANLDALGIAGVALVRADPLDDGAVDAAIRAARPDEIYYLAGQSSVSESFARPRETWDAATIGLMNVLAGARRHAPDARIVNAASGDCFGVTTRAAPATEASPFAPRSPYAAAKCAAHHLLAADRLAYGQWAASAFLFSHESPLRPERFVIAKVAAAARRIAGGPAEKLALGDISIVRDWGWAPDYVEALWRMTRQDEPGDFVIATGESRSLESLVAAIFASVGLDWQSHVVLDAHPPRPADIATQFADPSRAEKLLVWRATHRGDEIARLMVS